jgi:hypothetical protein
MSQENVAAVPQESMVRASFKNRFAAERMLASLGHTFRRRTRMTVGAVHGGAAFAWRAT